MKIASILLAPVLALVTLVTWHLPGAKRTRQQESQEMAQRQLGLGEAPGHIFGSPPKPPQL